MTFNPHDQAAIAFKRLLGIMDELREKCPWDRQQTWESLRHYTIEEVYELADAILAGELEAVKKELGDLLLHVVFYAKLGAEQQVFDITAVIEAICEKLIVRHPHVFADTVVENEAQVRRNWELLKLQEQNSKGGVLSGVPTSLPALVKALRIQEKARSVGFDWSDREQVWQKVEEELSEFKELWVNHVITDQEAAELEFGDLLFSLVNYARFIDINAETALEKTNRKFMKRFRYIEEAAQKLGCGIQDLTAEQKEQYWEEAKLLSKVRT